MPDDLTEKKNEEKIVDSNSTINNIEKLKEGIKEMKMDVSASSNIPESIQILQDNFKTGSKYWETNKALKTKDIWFSFNPSNKEKEKWMYEGIPKLSRLLGYLSNQYGSLETFDLVFFRENVSEPFYTKNDISKTIIYVNFDIYQKYVTEIKSAIRELKVSKYYWKVVKEFSKKIPIAFFNKDSYTSLTEELKNSYHGVIEEILSEYEEMPEGEEKNKLTEIVIHSKLARDSIKKYSELTSESPQKILNQVLDILPNISPKEFDIFVKDVLKSKSSRRFVKHIANLPSEQLDKIARNFTAMNLMFNQYEKLSSSLKKFEELIELQRTAETKDERKIHQFLTRHFWLLGIEYVDKEILSDYTPDGERTTDTKLENSRKHPDFIIKRLDGFDKCVVIELEEANDSIFTKSGEFSREVYDGIVQASDYNIEQKFRGLHSKGIAIIGSLKGTKLNTEHKIRFKLLTQEFPNVEILTYDQIIEKAKTTLNFWKENKIKKSLKMSFGE